MELIRLNTIEDFNQAVELIEVWNQARVQDVTYQGGGSHTPPDLTKPYADYDEAGLAINLGTSTPDNAVITILDNAEIPYEVEGNPDRYAEGEFLL